MSASDYGDLREALGNPELGPELLERALTHRSFAYENGGLPTNERLEFLGDAVLGVVVTDTLFREHPDLSEGRLAKLRAAVVNARALAEVARTIGLGEHIKLGRGGIRGLGLRGRGLRGRGLRGLGLVGIDVGGLDLRSHAGIPSPAHPPGITAGRGALFRHCHISAHEGNQCHRPVTPTHCARSRRPP